MNYLEFKTLVGTWVHLDNLLEHTGDISTMEDIEERKYVNSVCACTRIHIDITSALSLDSVVKINRVELDKSLTYNH
jgi:hypothetical protein